MNADERIARAVLGALRGMAAGDAIGAAGEDFTPEEIEDVYEGPITELIDPVNLYPEDGPDRPRGRIGPVSESALAFARGLTADSANLEAEGSGWPLALGLALPSGDAGAAVESARAHGGGSVACALAAAIAGAAGGYLARDVVGLAAEAAGLAGDRPLARLILDAAGAAQASGGRIVGRAVGEVASPAGDTREAVAFALGVAFGALSVRGAVLAAANEGGHASFTAAVAGAICGAIAPGSLVEAWSDEVEGVSELDLPRVAASLLRVRAEGHGRGG